MGTDWGDATPSDRDPLRIGACVLLVTAGRVRAPVRMRLPPRGDLTVRGTESRVLSTRLESDAAVRAGPRRGWRMRTSQRRSQGWRERPEGRADGRAVRRFEVFRAGAFRRRDLQRALETALELGDPARELANRQRFLTHG